MSIKDEMLRAIPHQNSAATLEENSRGVLVTIPLKKRWWVRPPVTWIFPISGAKRVQLDAMGAWVLSQCDGRHRVEDVVKQMMEKHKLSFQESRAAVLQFMGMLKERGIIAVLPGKK